MGANLQDQIERVLKPIQQFVRGWMQSQHTKDRAIELGLTGGDDLWIAGRAGVLGDCTSEAAAAGLGFLSPQFVAEIWSHLPAAGMTPSDCAREYAALCAQWGDAELSRFDPARMERLDELGRKVADAADGSLGAVFAGTRALPTPDGLGGRVALTMHVLRELRGAAHIVAVLASGLTPLDAVLVSPAAPPRSGPVWAEHLGWRGPFREPTDDMRAARRDAERLTSRLLEPAYGTLSSDELDEFAELVDTTRNAIDM